MDHAEARAFAEQWARAWNAHDEESVLTHVTDDVVSTSPSLSGSSASTPESTS